MNPYISMKFKISPEHLLEPFSVPTLISESVLAKQSYRNCTMSILQNDTTTSLVELDMVDFNVILGMEYIYSCYALIDYRTQIMKF